MSTEINTIKGAARDAVAEALGDAYDCIRCWSAWGVGTMRSDDFLHVADDEGRLEEITDAALAPALTVIDAQAAEIAGLREALQQMVDDFDGCYAEAEPAMIKARAALAQHQGEKHAEGA